MIAAILSFLGGSAFRMIWGEAAAWLNKKQDHAYELQRLAQQEGFAAAQHARNMESIKFQAEQQVKVIQVQGEQTIAGIEAAGWWDMARATTKQVGVKWVDAWNAAIRPGVATWGVTVLTLEVFALATVSEGTSSVIYAALGLYLADRTLAKRGK